MCAGAPQKYDRDMDFVANNAIPEDVRQIYCNVKRVLQARTDSGGGLIMTSKPMAAMGLGDMHKVLPEQGALELEAAYWWQDTHDMLLTMNATARDPLQRTLTVDLVLLTSL